MNRETVEATLLNKGDILHLWDGDFEVEKSSVVTTANGWFINVLVIGRTHLVSFYPGDTMTVTTR